MALHRYRITKPQHGGQDWLNVRFRDENGNKRVSASAVAAIYGLHPFVKKDTYAAELMADTAPTPSAPNAAMERGNRLEDTILRWASDRIGIAFQTPEEMFACDSPNGARMVATLDGFWEGELTDDDGSIYFARKVLEIKTTTRKWEGQLPDYWRLQGIQQAICADVSQIIWAVFDPSMNLHIHIQKVTQAEMVEHISAVETWLNAIELGMTPPGVVWSYETTQTRYPVAEPKTTNLDASFGELVAQLRHVRSEKASYAELEDQLKAKICSAIGDADTAVCNGSVVATWKPQTRKVFDQKAFAAAYPELASQFTKETSTRTFLLKGE